MNILFPVLKTSDLNCSLDLLRFLSSRKSRAEKKKKKLCIFQSREENLLPGNIWKWHKAFWSNSINK